MKLVRQVNGFYLLLMVLGLVLGGLLTACAGSSDGGGATQAGTVAVLLTDAPSDEFSAVNVTVNEVTLISNQGGQVTIFNGSRRINLLALQDVEDIFMIHDNVSVGDYNKIRLHVSDPEFVSLDGVTTIPSNDIDLVAGGKIDLVPRDSFRVSPGEILVIRLDLDVEKSIMPHPTSSDKYLLRPVVFVDILSDLSGRLVRVSGEIVEINPDAQSFLLRRTDPIFGDLGDGDENRPRLIRVEVPVNTSIFDPSGLPDGFAGDFSSLAKGQHVHVRGLLSLQEGLHIEARLIEIGDQFTRKHGLIISNLDLQNLFRLRPDGCQEDICAIDVQVHNETLIFEAGTHNQSDTEALVFGKRVLIEGVFDAVLDSDLLHAAVIVVKPDAVDLARLVGTIDNLSPADDRTFDLIQTLPCAPCLDLPVLIIPIPVLVMENALIVRIGREEDNHLEIERILFDDLKNGAEAEVFGHYDELSNDGFPFHALAVITFSTQPIP